MSHYNVTVNGVTYLVNLLNTNGEEISFSVDGQNYDIKVTRQLTARRMIQGAPVATIQSSVGPAFRSPVATTSISAGDVVAPIPGILSAIKVSLGDQVSAGDTVAIIEAMKMENPIRALCNGKVTHLLGKAGDEVKVGTVLIKIENT